MDVPYMKDNKMIYIFTAKLNKKMVLCLKMQKTRELLDIQMKDPTWRIFVYCF